ncbi:MAG: GNAT family N-acetyltransferase [Anaerolineales bacterium]
MIRPAFADAVVVCRPALPLDTKNILDFTRFIWEGHDYIPYVWKEWLANTDGLLAVAEYGGRTVGMARVARLTADQWWMEGFRVDPKYQGLRIGSHIHEYIDRWWLENGQGVVRLMTSSQRVQVHHLCDRLGYRKIAEVTSLGAEALDEKHDLQPCSPEDTSSLAKALRAAPTVAQTHGLLDLGWRFVTPCTEVLQPFFAEAGILEWRRGEGYLVTWEEREEEEPTLSLGLVACEWEALPDLLRAARALAAERHLKRVTWLAPRQPDVIRLAEAAGFVSLWENSGYIYQKEQKGA